MSHLRKMIGRWGSKGMLLLLLICVAVACFDWWFQSPSDDDLRPLAAGDMDLGSGYTEGAEVFPSVGELRDADPTRADEFADQVDFSRENVVRVRLSGSGYMTEREVDGKTVLSEVQYGQPVAIARQGGRNVYFHLYRPTPYTLYGTVHEVFSRRDFDRWFAVPKSATVRLLSGSGVLVSDLRFVLIVLVLAGGTFAAHDRLAYRFRNRSQRVPSAVPRCSASGLRPSRN